MQSQTKNAEIAQLVEHNLAKVRVASSSLVFRSKKSCKKLQLFSFIIEVFNFEDLFLFIGARRCCDLRIALVGRYHWHESNVWVIK